jgi:diguanylate cyclase (GGDEF)-like protein
MVVPMQVSTEGDGADLRHLTPSPGTPGTPAYSLVIRDIGDQREAHERLRLASASDHLTGVANRRTFDAAAEVEIARWHRDPRPLSLILFDADRFKGVNDSHGHAAGDAVLRHLAARIASVFRPLDVVARIGGEEFAVLLPSTGLDDAIVAAERVRRAVEAEPVVVDGVPIPVTLSGGVAAMNADTPDIAALLKRADQALYRAKDAGRNRIEVQPGTDRR